MSEKVAVITCAVLEIELAHFAREFSNVVHTEVLEQGLHNEPDKLRRELQAAIDRVETTTDADVIAAFNSAFQSSIDKDEAWLAAHP